MASASPNSRIASSSSPWSRRISASCASAGDRIRGSTASARCTKCSACARFPRPVDRAELSSASALFGSSSSAFSNSADAPSSTPRRAWMRAEIVVDLGRGLFSGGARLRLGRAFRGGAFARARTRALRGRPGSPRARPGSVDSARSPPGFFRAPRSRARDVADRMALGELRLEDPLEHLSVHVLRDGQAEVVEQRRRDVEHRGVLDPRAAAHVRARGHEDPVRLVVEVGLPHVHHLLAADAPLAALEAVVGEHEHGRGLEVDLREHPAEQLVLVAVPLAHHVAVAREPVLGEPSRASAARTS